MPKAICSTGRSLRAPNSTTPVRAVISTASVARTGPGVDTIAPRKT